MDKDPFHLTVETHHGRTVQWKGETYLYYSGTNYLGIAALKSVQALVVEGMGLYGCHVSISRSANIALPVFDTADRHVAEWLGMERAVLLSSGFTACQILLKSLEEEGRELIYTPGVHPANWRHLQDEKAAPWEQLLHKIRHAQHPIAVLCKSVDPIYLKRICFGWLQEVPRDKRVILVIDDSHTLGIHGKKGEGIYGELKEQAGERELILVGSLGKGLGMPAGVIGGSKHWIERVQESPYYAGASMPNPAFVHALMAIIPMLPALQGKLQRRIAQFEDALVENGWKEHFAYTERFPIFLCKSAGAFDYLKKKKILIAKFRYPSKDSDLVTRIVLNGTHTSADIQALCMALKGFYAPQEVPFLRQ